ncbi:MAG TPA: ATP-binding protein, partial [Terriglobales bacterium]|nr:ATP-binding protein [Terriglobales bacterium]
SEVRQALAGEYAAAVRRRGAAGDIDDRLRPRGRVRVYSALPIVSAGRTVSVMYMSRPSSSPLEAVWTLRHTIAVALIGCLLIMVTVTLFLSWAISRPVWAITAAADAVARGDARQSFETTGLIPAEVQVLAAALERMTHQLDERARLVAEFANNVSHELKTPLSSIRGAVELMRDEWQHMNEEQRQRFLANIGADVDRTQRLVQRLLQLARIEQSAEEIDSIPVRSFIADLADRFGERLQVHFADPPERIEMNGDHLETALVNLIDNALRHGAGKPVEVEVGRDGARLLVRVRDRGPGISEGNRRRLFERFFTTERDRGGTGLGLAIVKAIAESRGGSVRFDNRPSGTTFTLKV